MPNCFSLTRKGESEPMKLQDVDTLIAAHVGEVCDPVRWCRGWYDTIGFGLAMGETFSSLRAEYFNHPDLLPVIDFLAENFTTAAWYSGR